MNEFQHDDSTAGYQKSESHLPWRWLMAIGCVLVVLVGLLFRQPRENLRTAINSATSSNEAAMNNSSTNRRTRPFAARLGSSNSAAATAEEIVANKVNQFARSRREIARGMARRFNIAVLAEVERFFDLAEAGQWDELQAHFQAMREIRKSDSELSRQLATLWPVMMETIGTADTARSWPAQKLLDYGEAILGSLRPGMVYVGGTDPGRFIPTLLNETGEGERHVVLTQNALADNSYRDYVSYLYGDQFATWTKEEGDRAFSDYLSDAQRRMKHDEEFPHEPKQLRPGEDVRVIDNRVNVSGQIAVMSINEKLLQTLMEKNPNASFALEESFPLKSFFAESSVLGPIMELRVRDEQGALTREGAAQSADYWRTTAQQLLTDADAAGSKDVRMTYAKMAASQGGLFLERGYAAEAEAAFRAATEIAPGSPEAVFRYVNVLVEQKRFDEAIPLVENAVRWDVERQQEFRKLLDGLARLKKKG